MGGNKKVRKESLGKRKRSLKIKLREA